jgi:hypothetical protein
MRYNWVLSMLVTNPLAPANSSKMTLVTYKYLVVGFINTATSSAYNEILNS